MHEPYAALYSKGIAVGIANVHTDAVDFEFRKERFSIPTVALPGLSEWNGFFYTCKVRKLRKLAAKMGK